MIDDSQVWKSRLRRARTSLRRKLRAAAHDSGLAEDAFVEVEAFAFLAGYIVRKLIEARKLSDELESSAMKVLAYPARADYPLDFLSAHKIDRGYDLTNPVQREVGLRTICNLLVHSFVFMPSTNEGGTTWTGFFLNSDRTKNKELVFIAREDFDLLVDEVLKDDIVEMQVDRIRDRVSKSRFGQGESRSPISLNASSAPDGGAS
jgi:hypothetical protein